MSSPCWSRRALLLDVILIAGLHGLACITARIAGFDHVSDDDFARVTIAQTFAHAPRLDPSGTSWLPFPFWVLGGFMAVIGRSLASARAVSILFASIAATAPCIALRLTGAPRLHAVVATIFAFSTPWAIWLGASTVPESFTASLSAAGTVGVAAVGWRLVRASAIVPFALAILFGCLSRYEPWPVAAVLAIALVIRAARAETAGRRACIVAAVLCTLGPLAWMAWNAHAHDGPLHFFRRVSSFKRAIGDGTTNVLEALLSYPRLLVTTRPEVVFPALLLLPLGLRDRELRGRWALPLLCAAAQVAFLAYGNARDGAPAHHPERALFGTLVLLALFVGDVGLSMLRSPSLFGGRATSRVLAGAMGLAWLVSFAHGMDIPGRSPGEDRTAQLARGAKLRTEGASSIVITPCAFEHFALLAAYGAPENAKLRPSTNPPLTGDCPAVDVDH